LIGEKSLAFFRAKETTVKKFYVAIASLNPVDDPLDVDAIFKGSLDKDFKSAFNFNLRTGGQIFDNLLQSAAGNQAGGRNPSQVWIFELQATSEEELKDALKKGNFHVLIRSAFNREDVITFRGNVPEQFIRKNEGYQTVSASPSFNTP
jgi:hypothetical protein